MKTNEVSSAMGKPRYSVLTMVQLALLSGIIVILALTPLGMINLGVINATIIHVPVIIGAILLGPKAGAFLGGVFGLISLITNTVRPNISSFVFSPFYSVGETSGNGWSLIVCFVPRILIGVVAGGLFYLLSKTKCSLTVSCVISGLAGSLTNTLLVMGGIFVFFGSEYAKAQNVAFDALFGFIAGIVGTVGVPEAIVAAILSALVSRPLLKKLKKI